MCDVLMYIKSLLTAHTFMPGETQLCIQHLFVLNSYINPMYQYMVWYVIQTDQTSNDGVSC